MLVLHRYPKDRQHHSDPYRIHYRCAEAFGSNGNLLVGKAYTAKLDLKPGDEFEIQLGRKQIRWVPVGGADEDE